MYGTSARGDPADSPGRGLTFTIRLPVTSDARSAAPVEPGAEPCACSSSMTALVRETLEIPAAHTSWSQTTGPGLARPPRGVDHATDGDARMSGWQVAQAVKAARQAPNLVTGWGARSGGRPARARRRSRHDEAIRLRT
jgi:hypothetical protein